MAETPTDLVVKLRAEFDPPIEEVRRLTVHSGEALAVILPDGVRLSRDLVDRLQAHVQRSGLPCPALFFEHGTELAVVEAEAQPGG